MHTRSPTRAFCVSPLRATIYRFKVWWLQNSHCALCSGGLLRASKPCVCVQIESKKKVEFFRTFPSPSLSLRSGKPHALSVRGQRRTPSKCECGIQERGQGSLWPSRSHAHTGQSVAKGVRDEKQISDPHVNFISVVLDRKKHHTGKDQN